MDRSYASGIADGAARHEHVDSRILSTGAGGVQRALEEWLPQHPEVAFLNINRDVVAGMDAAELAYRDGSGLGILQRRPA